uniref:Uncharacterized protein n=1 Tax=Tanacetum cinerariifolium TaxID=118510 RepID=A0A6L2NKM7_TANCI|nr:hypothetical protein [Tanacetum cinerariifolium]
MVINVGLIPRAASSMIRAFGYGYRWHFSVGDTRRLIDAKILPTLIKPLSPAINIASIACSSYNGNVESSSHIFFDYDFTKEIWRLIRSWCDFALPTFTSRSQVRDLDSGEKFKTSTLGEIVSLEKSNKECHRDFYNSIIRDKVELKGKNVVGAFMNVPIFAQKFSIVTHFVVVENMDGYRDQDMGDIILEEPFYKASCMEAKRFDALITIHNGSDNVTYQMARSHPRFKHLSNTQCNKIKPLLKVSKPLLKVSLHDKLNGISHPYQKLKSFYKRVLKLGPEYVQDVKMEEWLTCGHISVHEIE